MKFRVSILVPMEFEVNCATEEEARGTVMSLLAEQREDSDYANVVADCIEEAVASNKVYMNTFED